MLNTKPSGLGLLLSSSLNPSSLMSKLGILLTVIFGIAGFTSILMFLINRQIDMVNKRIDSVQKRIGDIREEIKEVKQELREIRELLYRKFAG